MEREVFDVAIVGGGLAGISTAYFLVRSGNNCIVLEKDTIGSGATAKTTAFLTQAIDTYLYDLTTIFGEDKARLAWKSHKEAIDTVQEIITSESIDCSFKRCSFYYYAVTEKGFDQLYKEYETARRFGFNVELKKENDFPFKNFGVLEIKNQAKYFCSTYLKALAKTVERNGATVREHNEVLDIKRQGDIFEVTTANGPILAKNVVIATYYPFGKQTSTHFKKGMYISYVFKLKIPKGYVQEAIYEDTSNPYNYFRIDPGQDFDSMVIGGQDHRADIQIPENRNYYALEKYVRETFPGLKYGISFRWKGPILEPSDGLALIGEVSPGQYVATAFSGNGMTYSPIAGKLLSDLINSKENPYKELYDPKRFLNIPSMVIKGRDYIQENATTIFKNAFQEPESDS